jgi:hypothetical protein
MASVILGLFRPRWAWALAAQAFTASIVVRRASDRDASFFCRVFGPGPNLSFGPNFFLEFSMKFFFSVFPVF